MRIKFSFRWIPFLATVAVVWIGISLGNWQWRRADEKRAIEARLIARQAQQPLQVTAAAQAIDDIEYRRVTVRGEFDRDWPLYLDNRPEDGNAGFYLLMPFKIAGSERHVLVERGWFPVNVRNRSKMPPLMTPVGPLAIDGIAVRNTGHIMQLGQAGAVLPGAILQNITVADVAQASKFDMQTFVIEQTSNTPDNMLRNWPRPSVGIERHLGYLFQWYALALTAFLFFVVTGYRRGSR